MYDAKLDIEYVFDKMEMYELSFHMQNYHLTHKESWEQTRFDSYITAQCNSTKKLKITDILKFQWDNENANKNNDTTISKDDSERLTEKAKKYTQINGK